MDRKSDGVLDFLSGYPVFVRDLAVSLRATIRSTIPEAREMLDLQARVIGYGFGSGYADLICTIIPSKTGVKLGLSGERNCQIRRRFSGAPANGTDTWNSQKRLTCGGPV